MLEQIGIIVLPTMIPIMEMISMQIFFSISMKQLYPSYELSWRTEDDEKFRGSAAWKKIRLRILERDDFTCAYCGYRSEKRQQVNHIDGDPKNNEDENLETICPDCHRVMHSGLWCTKMHTMRLYSRSNYSQNDIIRITREMRSQEHSDEGIVKHLGLEGPLPWMQDLEYLRSLYAFNASGVPMPTPKRFLTEEEQKARLKNRDKW
jgi:hypothetical protein